MMKGITGYFSNFSLSKFWYGDDVRNPGNKFMILSLLLGFLSAATNTAWIFDKDIDVQTQNKIYVPPQYILLPAAGAIAGCIEDYLMRLSHVLNPKYLAVGGLLGLAYGLDNISYLFFEPENIGKEQVAYIIGQVVIDPIASAMLTNMLAQVKFVFGNNQELSGFAPPTNS